MAQDKKAIVRIFALSILGALIFSGADFVESAPPIGTPQLLTPQDASTVATTTPYFSWTVANRATSYRIQVTLSTDTTFSSPVINATTVNRSFRPSSPLALNAYIWRVRGEKGTSFGPWSSVFTFTVSSSPPLFFDDFSSYVPGTCFADGTVFGPWTLVFNGFGCTKIESSTMGQWLHTAPAASVTSTETHSALTMGPFFTGALTYEVDVTTVEQLRQNSPPNPWEVGWVPWNYTDNNHFYYFIAKPNGWELGKRDPVYPGGQRFLATGSSPTFPVGSLYHLFIAQNSANTISVSVNDAQITYFTDTERPYASGSIALYTEDAHVHFDNAQVTQP